MLLKLFFSGYDGEHCENDINECADNPCQNNGVCNDEIGKYSCDCSGLGFSGINCEEDINECLADDNPCQNGGNCTNEVGKFSCDCQDGWEGRVSFQRVTSLRTYWA